MSSDLPGLQTCPICDKELRGHKYTLLASIVDKPKNQFRLREFLNDIRSRKWSDVLRVNEWQGDSDVVQLYALKCPTSRLVLILVRSPVDLYDDDHIEGIESLTEEESATLNDVIKSWTWKPLS